MCRHRVGNASSLGNCGIRAASFLRSTCQLNQSKIQRTTDAMEKAEVAAMRAAIRKVLQQYNPFEPSVFYSHNGSIIVAIDAQKPWEDVKNYAKRVKVLLGDDMRMSIKPKDPILTCRVFLGGLRPALLDAIIKMKVDAYKLDFQRAYYQAWFIEKSSDDVEAKVKNLGKVFPPRWRTNVKPGRPSILQDGVVYYGETNASVDAFYELRKPIRSDLKILYRR